MLQHTFIHIPGIGKRKERELWARGICTWRDALEATQSAPNTLGACGKKLAEQLPSAVQAVQNLDTTYFERLGRLGESWRMYSEFADHCVFLDIETTGLSKYSDEVTVVGLYDGHDYRAFIDGRNLQHLAQELKRYAVVVTYNGSGFDLPFLKAKLPVQIPAAHIDLRWVARKLGYAGGLKHLEPELGIKRPRNLAEVDGFEAVRLWNRYRRGDNAALELLIDYNRADVVNLKPIMETLYTRLAEQHIGGLAKAAQSAASS